ncbi:uncharacterized protein TRIADDRAFT_31222 [Trichoplax adhaerens]|uniref:Thiamine pyrophosphokinase 1 n=1 Tax=Trichoplax adhaerens TaxID=10228 RepID=B3S8K4_TRIAD|nr:hypothetical protein TRIADDRAFT_31222 [Trichoplax adhaerens]EDV20970.1 hypothetical protein TRIADDRAFT_31222 [Trichoplax adhaerens]|eukprot:XP_002116614.1 hypothetical protein TRIADDRAFT_31222 [Trichoplax adhaerens]
MSYNIISHFAAKLTVCADGGANYVFELLDDDRNKYIPDVICGDLDSVNSNAQNYYKDKGTIIVHKSDEDENDFLKCLRLVLQTEPYRNIQCDYIIALGAVHDRFDQSMASIHALYVAAKISRIQIILLSVKSYICLLTPGQHKVLVNTEMEGNWCSLLPIGNKCNNLRTTGLKWNLPGIEFAFGSLISTSNAFDGSNEVTITTDDNVIWSMEINYTLN